MKPTSARRPRRPDAGQLQAFEAAFRQRLKQHVRGISIGHVSHVKDVLPIRDEMLVKVDLEFQEVAE